MTKVISPPANEIRTDLLFSDATLAQVKEVYGSALAGIQNAMAAPDVVEIKRLPDRDGEIWIRRLTERGQIEESLGVKQSENDAVKLTQIIAYATGRDFSRDRPTMRTVMPVYNYRFTAMCPPRTNGIFWTFRRRIVVKTTLEECVKRRQMAPELYGKLMSAIKTNKRIAVVGPQSVGKTVFATAILRATAGVYPDTFFVILEDAWEIDLEAPQVLYVSFDESEEGDPGILIPTLVRSGAKSLSFGEISMRADAAIESWGTGVRRTSALTVHGEEAIDAYLRLEQIHKRERREFSRVANQKAVERVVVMDPYGPDGLPRITGMFKPAMLTEEKYDLIAA